MINQAPEFVSISTIALLFDSSASNIRTVLARLKDAGHRVDVLEWGGGHKPKINLAQFRKAVYAEYLKR